MLPPAHRLKETLQACLKLINGRAASEYYIAMWIIAIYKLGARLVSCDRFRPQMYACVCVCTPPRP